MESRCKNYPPFCLGLAGPIGSGKSTIISILQRMRSFNVVGFGDYVTGIAKDRKLPIERAVLQSITEEVISSLGHRGFVSRVLASHNIEPGQSVIVDGIRFQDTIGAVRDELAPMPFFVLYVSLDEEVRLTRLKLRDGVDDIAQKEFDNHFSEVEVQSLVRDESDLIVSNTSRAKTFDEIDRFLRVQFS